MAASQYELDRLTVIVDRNRLQQGDHAGNQRHDARRTGVAPPVRRGSCTTDRACQVKPSRTQSLCPPPVRSSYSQRCFACPWLYSWTYLLPPGLPRGAAELGQLQDHYHQDDNDQVSDDDSDNSSVHFASLICVLIRNFRPGR